ncbi:MULTISPECIES: alpha/beta hydrolase domain-containing protein [unclassified Frankia]|uniref:alpha/beta hydrolase domain-containing protein n=1 Tax=unclassified Frankia TaxID=2632575 RepID=UPI002AD1E2F4|nr:MULTISPECIES: alpha/beta hydrolase domain-containing protein [unclassified Frankia]
MSESARLTGPVSGGTRGWPMSTTLVDVSTYGYVEEEYFFEGDATTYRLADGELRADGRWTAEPSDTHPFKTRMIIRRPVDAAKFNGTVIVSWINVSMGSDMFQLDTPETFEGGFAVVAVSAQAVGVHGFDTASPQGLVSWDPERYGSLAIPSDDASYGIFTAAAQLVGPKRDLGANDPMGGLDVKRLLATGASQSAARLHTYFNAVQPLTNLFDGFLLDVHFGWVAPLSTENASREPNLQGVVDLFQPVTRLRDDLDIPVLVVNTETETPTYFRVRQPDTEMFRLWEAAGTAHASSSSIQEVMIKFERDWGTSLPASPTLDRPSPNTVNLRPLRDASLFQMQRWLTEHIPPPAQPRIEIGGEPPTVVRDANGIARGGIRLPTVAVPTAKLTGSSGSANLIENLPGSSEPFSPETLKTLYPTRELYLEKVEKAVSAGMAAGFILPRDAARIMLEAESSATP